MISVKRKRSRIMRIQSDSDESDRENESDNNQSDAKAPKRKLDGGSSRKSAVDSPLTKTKKLKRDSTALNKSSFEDKIAAGIAESKDGKSSIKIKEKESDVDNVTATVWLHNKLEFLRADKIRDAEKRRPGDPQYDPTTLFVPESYLNSLTPVSRILSINH